MNKPNILFLHAHNTGRHIQPYGYAVPTPRLQKLAEEGVLFRKAFTVSPTCSPSRACLLTGQYPHTCGMLGLAHRGFHLHNYDHTLVKVLNAAGYHTVLAGLQHIAPDRETLDYKQDLDPVDSWGANVATGAVKFLDNAPAEPFFLDVGIKETHRAFPDATPEDDPRYMMPPAGLPDHPDVRQDYAEFCASARQMDHTFSQILDALDRNGLSENTLVVCLSDHGLQFPDHMCNLTDRGLETFFIMRGPGGFDGGKVVDAMVTHMDLFPTFCELAGVDTPDWVQGKSIMPLMDGRAEKIHEQIFGEVTYHAAYEAQRCIRTERYKYIRRYDDRDSVVMPNTDRGLTRDVLFNADMREQPRWQEGLFDLIFDPNEMNNRVDDPSCQEVLADLRNRLDEWMKQTDDLMQSGERPMVPGTQYCDPDGLHPMDRILDYPA